MDLGIRELRAVNTKMWMTTDQDINIFPGNINDHVLSLIHVHTCSYCWQPESHSDTYKMLKQCFNSLLSDNIDMFCLLCSTDNNLQ